MMVTKRNYGNGNMYTSDDIAELCGCSKNKAYNMIRALNHKLISLGTPKEALIAGKISRKFFHEQIKI
ncbi:hypothetical protein HMPREF0202_00686 [Cetobacterium somerae ATCC BAA-474]|uniref:Helix-turn-helix domain-containing protein n=1 Tax=Cetobacterium somerae ATCC BAA-474 TaxID=1319815 RepID=U7VD37_9FUSO|nr:hypothetical protein [Cetobacterium somerae]ERT69416.1 hypothetical protein HMPREF0202_00686 [Cetobacterium somerae ATCC BAA-474]